MGHLRYKNWFDRSEWDKLTPDQKAASIKSREALSTQARALRKRFGAVGEQTYLTEGLKGGKEVREYIRGLKEKGPCKDCGVKYPYYVMQFDHREGENKLFHISQAHTIRLEYETLNKEIAKCDIVCANCHAERTHKRLPSARN